MRRAGTRNKKLGCVIGLFSAPGWNASHHRRHTVGEAPQESNMPYSKDQTFAPSRLRAMTAEWQHENEPEQEIGQRGRARMELFR